MSESLMQRRNSKLKELRASLKTIPIVRQQSERIQNKYENLVLSKATGDLEQSTNKGELSECESLRDITEDEPEEVGYNLFLEKYQLLEKLGQGGNASVYKCLYKPNGRFYAAKKFRIEQEHIQELKRNFINIKELNHPSICKYRALYFDQNQRFAFLVMEYLPYPSLAQYFIQSQNQLRQIVKEIVQAITYIHHRNMCHRDIKPENIIYNQKEKQIKIIDFGISKKTFLRGVRRDMLTIIGTHNYLAPQVYNGGGYDERIDLWALGVTVYKMIAGYTPFQSEYHSDTVANILKGVVKYDDMTWNDYSPFAYNFVVGLLKNKQERMTLAEAEKHLWLQIEQTKKTTKVNRVVSHDITVNRHFHNEFRNNIKHATSKQQGCLQDDKKLYKNVHLINVNEYELQDSDDENSVVTPKTNENSEVARSKMVKYFSCFDTYTNIQGKQQEKEQK